MNRKFYTYYKKYTREYTYVVIVVISIEIDLKQRIENSIYILKKHILKNIRIVSLCACVCACVIIFVIFIEIDLKQ